MMNVLLGARQVAEILEMSPETVRRLVISGLLKAKVQSIPGGPRRNLQIDMRAVRDFQREQHERAQAAAAAPPHAFYRPRLKKKTNGHADVPLPFTEPIGGLALTLGAQGAMVPSPESVETRLGRIEAKLDSLLKAWGL